MTNLRQGRPYREEYTNLVGKIVQYEGNNIYTFVGLADRNKVINVSRNEFTVFLPIEPPRVPNTSRVEGGNRRSLNTTGAARRHK